MNGIFCSSFIYYTLSCSYLSYFIYLMCMCIYLSVYQEPECFHLKEGRQVTNFKSAPQTMKILIVGDNFQFQFPVH